MHCLGMIYFFSKQIQLKLSLASWSWGILDGDNSKIIHYFRILIHYIFIHLFNILSLIKETINNYILYPNHIKINYNYDYDMKYGLNASLF